MPSGGRLRGVLPMPEDEDDGASSTMAQALALTEDSDFGEMEDEVGPPAGKVKK